MGDHTDSKTVSQQEFDKLINRYFIHSMIPFHHIDKPYFENLFLVFDIDKLGLKVMSSASLESFIGDTYTKLRTDIKTKLQDIKHVCIHAEHVSRYLIVTCYWIGLDLTRQSCTLAFRKFSFDYIDFRFCHKWNIKKIVGINDYIKMTDEEQGLNICNKYEIYVPDSVVVMSDIKESTSKTYVQPCIDQAITIDDTYNDKHKTVVYRITSTWNTIQNAAGQTTSAQIIENILGHSLTIPKISYRHAFNTYHDFQQILSVQEKYKELQTALEIKKPLLEEDFVFIAEYVKLYKPFVDATNILEYNKDLFYGVILPCLLSLRKKLIRLSNDNYEYVYWQPAKCLALFEERFAELFNLSTDIAVNAAIAAISHPKFKDRWFSCIDDQYHDKIRDAFKEAVVEELTNKEHPAAEQNVDDFFNFDEGLVDHEYKAEALITRYLTDNDTDITMLHRHEEIKRVFIKYNTPLSIKRFDYMIHLFNTVTKLMFITDSDELLEKMVLLKCNETII